MILISESRLFVVKSGVHLGNAGSYLSPNQVWYLGSQAIEEDHFLLDRCLPGAYFTTPSGVTVASPWFLPFAKGGLADFESPVRIHCTSAVPQAIGFFPLASGQVCSVFRYG